MTTRIHTDICAVGSCDRKRAKGRSLCPGHQGRKSKKGDVQAHIPLRLGIETLCRVDGCDRPRHGKNTLCSGHHDRQTRLGDPQADKPLRKMGTPGSGTVQNGYTADWLPDHPLAGRSGRVRRHRAVLFDAIGPGAHPCHWCSRSVDWSIPWTEVEGLVVDHLDGDTQNNDRANLVASCNPCNAGRTATGGLT